jgi:glyoxylase I family protein
LFRSKLASRGPGSRCSSSASLQFDRQSGDDERDLHCFLREDLIRPPLHIPTSATCTCGRHDSPADFVADDDHIPDAGGFRQLSNRGHEDVPLQHLGFKLGHQQLPAFANVSLGDAQILLSGPGASGSRPMPNGQPQEPGGWIRVVLKVSDLPGFMNELRKARVRFRNEIETGPGGRQIQIEDPDGNPIELFATAR